LIQTLSTEAALFAHLTNTSRRILCFRQAFVLRRKVSDGPLQVVSASSIPAVDREAPMIRWIEKIAARLSAEAGVDAQHVFTLPAYCDDNDEDAKTYPFAEFCWTPLKVDNKVIGVILAARETPWTARDLTLFERLSDLNTHSLLAIKGKKRPIRQRIFTKKRTLLASLVLVALALFPVPLTALAPVKVVPAKPFIVAAPFNGVVREILVDQSEVVNTGVPLVAFEDVRQRNELEITERQAGVAAARLQRIAQRAIADPRETRDLAVAQAEYDLAIVERDYAAELLGKTILRAEREGVAVFSDKRDWVARPVAAGEAILEIADPQNIEFSIDLPVGESIVLSEGARVKIFLDSAPLKPVSATLTRKSYQPRADERNVMAYRLTATLDEETASSLPRIGIQGTAQIYGDKVPAIYAVLRRPLAAFRQLTGI